MNIRSGDRNTFRIGGRAPVLSACIAIACGFLLAPTSRAAEPSLPVAPDSAVQQSTFSTPEAAADALVSAAGNSTWQPWWPSSGRMARIWW